MMTKYFKSRSKEKLEVFRQNFFVDIEERFSKIEFVTFEKNDVLYFKRNVESSPTSKGRILIELFYSFINGKISVYNDDNLDNKIIECNISFLKHFIVSLVVSVVIAIISRLFTSQLLLSVYIFLIPFFIFNLFGIFIILSIILGIIKPSIKIGNK